MTAWLSKWGPLAGTVSALLVVASLATGNSNTPGDNATAAQVIRFYTDNHAHRTVSDFLIGITMLFLVLFAVTLPRHVRRGERWIANGAIAGAVWAAIGFVMLSGFDLVLAVDYKDLTPASAPALNLLENDFALPVVIGFGLFGILAGLAVVAGRILPVWMGWVLFAVGIVCLIPPITWFALLGTMLWVLVASIWMVVQGPPAVERGEPVPAEEHVLA
jgi:hypothetical protein